MYPGSQQGGRDRNLATTEGRSLREREGEEPHARSESNSTNRDVAEAKLRISLKRRSS